MTLRALYDVAAPAKVNLFLHVVGRRADGYHLLQSVFVLIDWCDTLHVERRDDERLARHDLGAPLPADDLCLRAAKALRTASGCRVGCDLSIDKQVPSGAGLGGGSSDAASTLLALNRLWGLNWTRARLAELALGLGADVPFFLGNAAAIVEGIGERVTPITLSPQWLAVVKPAASLDTGSIFASPLLGGSTEAAILEGFTEGSPNATPTGSDAVWDYGRNDLQAAAEARCPEVAQAGSLLRQTFGNSRMSGSGSAVFARAGGGERPVRDLPAPLPVGWSGRMCRSLGAHPLASWAD